jgi:hypothetical protein
VFADLEPLVIAGVMLLGWLVIALYEWAATRELPHYGRGLPPRYYVPQVSLPPPRQLEQLRSGYPAPALDDQATWIASPAMRAETFADWPVGPVDVTEPPSPAEDTMIVPLVGAAGEPFHEDTWIELDPIAEGGAGDEEAAVALAEPEVEEPAPEPEPEEVEAEPEPVVEPEAVVVAAAAVVEELAPVDEDVAEERPDAERQRWWRRSRPAETVAVAAVSAEVAEEVLEPDADEVEEPEPVVVAAATPPVVDEPEVAEEVEEDTEEDVVAPAPEPRAPAAGPLARHTFDPLGEDSASRRRRRRRDDPWVEVPDRPPTPRVLPGTSRREQRDEAPA